MASRWSSSAVDGELMAVAEAVVDGLGEGLEGVVFIAAQGEAAGQVVLNVGAVAGLGELQGLLKEVDGVGVVLGGVGVNGLGLELVEGERGRGLLGGEAEAGKCKKEEGGGQSGHGISMIIGGEVPCFGIVSCCRHAEDQALRFGRSALRAGRRLVWRVKIGGFQAEHSRPFARPPRNEYVSVGTPVGRERMGHLGSCSSPVPKGEGPGAPGALSSEPGCVFGEVGDDEVGAGAADSQQRFQDGAVAV